MSEISKKYRSLNSCVYTGSFIDGRNRYNIRISRLPKIKFNLYGNINTLNNEKISSIKKLKNVKLNNFLEYRKIPKILMSNKILLMPYEKKNWGFD